MKDRLPGSLDDYELVKRYIKSIGKGLLKVMSKMGISTYQSYCGAQIFDAVGLKADFVAKYFAGTHTRIEGVGLRRNRRGDRAPPWRRIRRCAGLQVRARRRRRICLPHPRRGSCLDRGNRRPAAACGARQFAGALPGVRQGSQRAVRAAVDPARPVPDQDRRGREAQADQARPGRAGQGDRQAFRHRRHELRLDLARGAYHAGDRDEPDRRQVQHRRRRRRVRSLQADAERQIRCGLRSSRSPRAASA